MGREPAPRRPPGPYRIAFMVCFIAGLAFSLAHCTAQRTLDNFPRSQSPAPAGTGIPNGDVP